MSSRKFALRVFAVAAVMITLAAVWTFGSQAKTSTLNGLSQVFGLPKNDVKSSGIESNGGAELTESPQYVQGFEVDNVWGDPPTDPARVASGTNGITSRTGGFHAQAVAGNFTRWGGYSSTFPSLGFTTSIDIYLNMSGGYANDTRFDYSSAISNTGGTHRRDFIFSGGFYSDAGPVGSGNRFVVSASNNSPGNPRDPGRSPVAITTSGWYKFKHRFINNAGVLAVEMRVINASNITVGTWTLSDPSDVIGSTVGGNRYGWFVTNNFPFLAIDNTTRANIVPPANVIVSDLNPQGWTFFNEGANGSGSFVTGPATPPLGTGSANLIVDATGRHNIGIAGYAGTRLDRITELGYSSYQVSGNAAATIGLQLQVDYDLTDANPAFQGRLVYEPYNSETILQNTWQTWTPLTGKWWSSGAPGNTVCPQSTPCTWAQVLTAFPNAGIHANPALGAIIFRAGGPVGFPFTGNVDNFTLGIDNQDTVIDFEPANALIVDDDGMAAPGNCDAASAASASIAGSVAAAAPGSTIEVCSGVYPTPAVITLNKSGMTILGIGPTKPVVQGSIATTSSGNHNVFHATADNVTLDNLEIQKTDVAGVQELIWVQGNNFTAKNNLIYGANPGMTWDAAGVVSRAFIVSVSNNLLLQNNVIHTLRQPAYMSGSDTSGGSITGNQVSGTKGWVIEGGNYVFSGNTFGEPQNQSCDIALLATLSVTNIATYQPLLALSTNNDNGFICAQYGGGENGRATSYVDDSAGPGGNGSDNANHQSINTAAGGTLTGGTVQVAAGGYTEDVTINRSIKVLGAGSASTTIIGAIGGPGATMQIAASNVEVSGFTITRAGNNVVQWNDPGLNLVGIAIQGQAITNALIHDNRLTGNRSGIDINNSNGHTIRNNQITDNRTGLIFRNQTDNLSVTENDINNNWTVGIVFLDASGGTNSPVQTAANCTFFNNNISGNWYGQVVDRQSGGSLPAPGTNLKNFSGNWLGSTAPVVTTANSAEPGYAAQIPVAFGGTATPPGGQPDIAGPASGNLDYSPFLNSGLDTGAAFGFQGGYTALNVNATSPQAAPGAPSNIQEGINLVTAGGTLNVAPGTYAGNVNVNKALDLKGNFTVSGSLSTSVAGVSVSPGASPGIINSGNLSLGTGTTVNIELNGTTVGTQYDQLNVTGTVNIATDVVLSLTTGFTPSAGNTFTIVNNDGADPVSGTFKDLPEGSVFYIGLNAFNITYAGGAGNNDVVLTSVLLCNAVSIPTNITTLTGQTVVAPVNVDDTTGNALFSTDFWVTYDPAVVTFNSATLGNVTAGSVLTVNTATAGVVKVSIFNSTPFSGAGQLANITFNAVGQPGTSSPINFTQFKFNEGTPCVSTSNGLITILSGSITGNINYGNPVVGTNPRYVPNVTVSAVGSVNVATSTDTAGLYTLSGMGSGPYTVTPSKSGGVNGAISGLDASRIAQFVVGSVSLTPTQQTVADVSGTGGVSSFDAALIARYVVSLPNAGSTGNWIFTPVNRSYANVNTNQTGQDYAALLMGDVTGNWDHPISARFAPQLSKPLGISAGQVTVSPSAEVLVPIQIGNTEGKGIVSYQFDLTYDPAVLTPSESAAISVGTLSENMIATVNTETPGRLKVVVFGALPIDGEGVLLNLKFTAIGAIGTSSDLVWDGFGINEGGLGTKTADGRVTVTAPAANESSISGYLLTAQGQGVPNTRVTLTGINGGSRTVVSNGFGHYTFGDVEPGQTYTITVEDRRFTFVPVMVSVSQSLTRVDLIAQP